MNSIDSVSRTLVLHLCNFHGEHTTGIIKQRADASMWFSSPEPQVLFNCGEFSFVLENNFRNTENSMFINYFLLGNGYTFRFLERKLYFKFSPVENKGCLIAYHASFSFIILKTIQTKSVLSVLENYQLITHFLREMILVSMKLEIIFRKSAQALPYCFFFWVQLLEFDV